MIRAILRWLCKPRGKNQPLEVRVTRNKLVISIGIDVLAFATERNPELYHDAYRRAEAIAEATGKEIVHPETYCTVADKHELANDIARELQREQEDGTTPLDILLDEAALAAMEDGSLAFDEESDEDWGEPEDNDESPYDDRRPG